MSRDVECPYCGKWNEINHDDGYGYEEGKTYSQECDHCENTFTFTTQISFDYEAEKAPCLNGEGHKWKDIVGYPKGYQSNRHRCEWCDREDLKNTDLRYDPETDTWNKR